MNKTIKHMALLGAFLLTAPQALAGLITNGDFGTTGACNLSGWDVNDFDGDVSVIDNAGACSANLSVSDDPNFFSELSQGISFANDTDYVLSVDFNLGTTLNQDVFDDFFAIDLINTDFDYYEL